MSDSVLAYTGLVEYISRTGGRGHSVPLSSYTGDTDDIRQELWLALCEKEHKIKGKSPFGMAKLILMNRVTDIIRKSMVRADVNSFVKTSDTEGAEDAHIKSGTKEDSVEYPKAYYPTQDSDYEFQELKDNIIDWADTQDAQTMALLSEFVDPSDETLKWWGKEVKRYPHYKTHDMIPPSSLAGRLGIGKPKACSIMKSLRTYLKCLYQDID